MLTVTSFLGTTGTSWVGGGGGVIYLCCENAFGFEVAHVLVLELLNLWKTPS